MYDKIIIGAGIYGLYSALYCGKKGQSVLVFEKDSEAFKRATFINQARVHNGYHYPRSLSTALKSAKYFERFNKDFEFAINKKFNQIYATSNSMSWTNNKQFVKFCEAANIRCDELSPNMYFKNNLCDGAFLTEEYTYDAQILKKYFLEEISKYKNVKIIYNSQINKIEKNEYSYSIWNDDKEFETNYLLNCTYGSVNQILQMMGLEPFAIKYELCEIILCKVNQKLKDIGLTVMDGPFFSIMPFGKTGFHSLTSVTFTPHITSYDVLPTFKCQNKSGGFCSSISLGNCNDCREKPKSAFPYMSNLARKYMKEDYKFEYASSLFSMKPILKASEIDDSRPTVIKEFTSEPRFVSVLSGKINTIYDLDDYLD